MAATQKLQVVLLELCTCWFSYFQVWAEGMASVWELTIKWLERRGLMDRFHPLPDSSCSANHYHILVEQTLDPAPARSGFRERDTWTRAESLLAVFPGASGDCPVCDQLPPLGFSACLSLYSGTSFPHPAGQTILFWCLSSHISVACLRGAGPSLFILPLCCGSYLYSHLTSVPDFHPEQCWGGAWPRAGNFSCKTP